MSHLMIKIECQYCNDKIYIKKVVSGKPNVHYVTL